MQRSLTASEELYDSLTALQSRCNPRGRCQTQMQWESGPPKRAA